MANVTLPEQSTILSMAAAVNGYNPNTPAKCSERILVRNSTEALVKSIAYDRNGIFLRGLMISYNLFTVHNVFRLGFLMEALTSPYTPKQRVRINTSHLLLLWTDQLTEIDSLYDVRKGGLMICTSKREALDHYQRISKLLEWITTEKNYHLKNVTSRDLVPIFSEYVMDVGTRLSTLQSAFQKAAQKSLKTVNKHSESNDTT